MALRRETTVGVVLIAAGLVLGLIGYQVQIDDLRSTTEGRAFVSVAIGWSFVLAGLIAWSRRPESRVGPLMVLLGFAALARQLRYGQDPFLFTPFLLLGELPYALIVHATLAYPSGRLKDAVDRRFVPCAYAIALGFPLAILLTYDGTHPLRWFDDQPRESLLYVAGNEEVVHRLQDAYAVCGYGVVATVFIALVARKLYLATPRARRILWPLLVAAAVAALRAVFDSLVTFNWPPPEFVRDNLFWWQAASLLAMPVALLVGLLRAQLARLTVAGLVVDLEDTPPLHIRDALARALDDPSLEVAFWLPERREFVTAEGTRVTLPENSPTRAVTRLEHDGHPLAALVHDASLGEEPELVEAAGAAARLALENARLHAEVQSQLAKVKESRARIVTAGDEQRRRIERDLHDGAQQRLVALALDLRRVQRELGGAVDPEVDRLLTSTAEELQVAVQELRELAGGIHPPILTQSGLAAALGELASRAPLRVTVDAPLERLPADVEVTAYFVASEALTNAAKHARASRATIAAAQSDGRLVVEVADDGIGGAHWVGGSGLRGLADRVEALGGRLVVDSPPGGGTRISAEIPCAS
jgi:signal transduction histidine kinase